VRKGWLGCGKQIQSNYNYAITAFDSGNSNHARYKPRQDLGVSKLLHGSRGQRSEYIAEY
jgi:hypothetical protein